LLLLAAPIEWTLRLNQLRKLSLPVSVLIGCLDDDSNNVTLTIENGQKLHCKTTWTLLLYLTSSAEGCEGGETVFYPRDRKSQKEEIAVSLETGMLLLHKHGDDCMLVSNPTLPYHIQLTSC